MRFPQDFIENLKQQADLVRIVGDYAPLKKKGANYWGCCPFHGEKTPSMSVNPSKGFYKCFGCGVSGTAFNFIMEMEKVSFPEAIKIVAERSNVPLPILINDEKAAEFEKKQTIKKKEAEEVIELNAYALEFWENLLQENNNEAKIAREYLEKRNLSDETQKAFRLGYALDSWDALMSHLKSKGADDEQIAKSGLVSINEEKKRVYDRFRGRIIFPVLDEKGRPVAFGARILDKGEPKYLNSPETAAYTKGNNLYGLFQAKNEIKQKKFAILVEGYLDLITPYQHGIKNVVASLGTALTSKQAKLLGRFARKIVVNYDGDKAGIKAAKRAIEVLLPEDFEIKVLVLPEGADPDDFIRQNGAEGYNEKRGQSQTFFNFLIDEAAKNRNLSNPKEKSDALEEITPALQAVKNSVQKRDFFDSAMTALRIEDLSLKREIWRSVKFADKTGKANDNNDINERLQRVQRAQKPTVAEIKLLELLIHDSEVRTIILPQLEPTDYEPLATSAIFQALLSILQTGENVAPETILVYTQGDDTAAELVPQIWMNESPRQKDEAIDEVLLNAERCAATLRTMALDRRMRDLTFEVATAQQNQNNELLYALVQEQVEIARLKIELARLIA